MTYAMMDDPGGVNLEEWEAYLKILKALPEDTSNKPDMIARAEQKIAWIRTSNKLADAFDAATDGESRAVCLALCRLAARRTGLDHPLVDAGLRLLENGTYDEGVVTALEDLVLDLEGDCNDAEHRYEYGDGDRETYLRLCRNAQAATAVLYALNDHPLTTLIGSIHKACEALGDDDLPLSMLRELRSKQGAEGLAQ